MTDIRDPNPNFDQLKKKIPNLVNMEKQGEKCGLWGENAGVNGVLDSVLEVDVDYKGVERKMVNLVDMERGTGRGVGQRKGDELADVGLGEGREGREDFRRVRVKGVVIKGPTERRVGGGTVVSEGKGVGKDLEGADLNKALGATKPHAPEVDIGKYASRDKP